LHVSNAKGQLEIHSTVTRTLIQ